MSNLARLEDKLSDELDVVRDHAAPLLTRLGPLNDAIFAAGDEQERQAGQAKAAMARQASMIRPQRPAA